MEERVPTAENQGITGAKYFRAGQRPEESSQTREHKPPPKLSGSEGRFSQSYRLSEQCQYMNNITLLFD